MSDAKVQLIDVVKEFPARRGEKPVRAVDQVTMDIYDGEFFAMLGPSGCGKTTTLRLIAGFEQPSSGQVIINGVAMQGIPPYHRPVNTVFQDYALFPHMTVMQNVTFGLEMAGVTKKEATKRAQEALEMVRLPAVGKRKPRELSGGQQQRIALARALVNHPSVLLLDEPLGALDLKLRREMQLELKTMQQELGITFVFVTHDQEEAMTMANRIAVMDGGHVLQVGRPEEIYETPANRFVADFIGETNFLKGKLIARNGVSGTVQLDGEARVEALLGGETITEGAEIIVAIRPERILLKPFDATEKTDGLSVVTGQIQTVYYIGTDTRYIVHLPNGAELTVRVQNTDYEKSLAFKERQTVNVVWDKSNARILLD
jgi:spermidine/putrescine transport system ATP-binding protein